MELEIRVPEVGEAVKEAMLAQWYKQDGETVRRDDILFVIETDKVTLEVSAEADGVLRILVPEGETVAIGAVVGKIEVVEGGVKTETPPAKPEPLAKAAPAREEPKEAPVPLPREEARREESGLQPSVRSLVEERGVDVSQIAGTGPGGRITKGDVMLHLEESGEYAAPPTRESAPPREQVKAETADLTLRKPMTPIRQRIAERLLEARRNTAMLTTFNEIDMSRVQEIRSRYKTQFKERHGVSLGLMSFFVKASIAALKEVPQINAFIDGRDILYHSYYHIGVAVGAERGLVVPVIRDADRLSFADIERAILDFIGKINENKLGLSDLEGGTFTISNGGIYGSLLSTPILNTPQSGILGLHKIEERPVVVNGQIVIRPMMYVALSYDHRIVDGREAVTFLKRIKECIEAPERMMVEI
ncbi:MAG: 2-oxoglutarate dehydrogenase complex dihydrolipoyllysine-residue succinyltransferase [Acidobacteriota bacterium]